MAIGRCVEAVGVKDGCTTDSGVYLLLCLMLSGPLDTDRYGAGKMGAEGEGEDMGGERVTEVTFGREVTDSDSELRKTSHAHGRTTAEGDALERPTARLVSHAR